MSTLGVILLYAVFGLVVGALARLLVPGRQPMGLLMTIGLGIAGTMLGGFIASLFGRAFEPAGFILSLVCAVVLLAVYIYFVRRRAPV